MTPFQNNWTRQPAQRNKMQDLVFDASDQQVACLQVQGKCRETKEK
jgi:hypothetical protein